MKDIVAVIPARLGSVRLPEKPLKDINGKSLVQRAWERIKDIKELTRVVIATDSDEIFQHAKSFGAEVIMTAPELACGSERVAKAAEILAGKHSLEESFSLVLNCQGDMPFLPQSAVSGLIQFALDRNLEFQMTTIASPIIDEEQFKSTNTVKVVVSEKCYGLYFSRAPIPFPREVQDKQSFQTFDGQRAFGYKHYGLYAFTPAGLKAYIGTKASHLEQIERLEQLRVLESGGAVGVHLIRGEMMRDSVEVDTEVDLEKARAIQHKKG